MYNKLHTDWCGLSIELISVDTLDPRFLSFFPEIALLHNSINPTLNAAMYN